MLEAILEILQLTYGWSTQLLEVDTRCDKLDDVVNDLRSIVEDMNALVRSREEERPGRQRMNSVNAFFNKIELYRAPAREVVDRCRQEQYKVRRMMWVRTIEQLLREGEEHIKQGRQLIEQGLTFDGVVTRGDKLVVPEDQYQGPTFRGVLDSAVTALRDGTAPCIGIYGQACAGKTNLMKHLHNSVWEDPENFKAVYWATAPEPPADDNNNEYHKALQKRVAEGMRLTLNNGLVHDVVRTAAEITAPLQGLSPGWVVVFLDGVQREFQPCEVLGMPSIVTQHGPTYATAANINNAPARGSSYAED